MSDLSKLSHEDALRDLVSGCREGHLDGRIEKMFQGILARMSSTEPNWQPIETAPKDTLVWVLERSGAKQKGIKLVGDTGIVVWAPAMGPVDEFYAEVQDPTHWAPRPKGPA